MSGVTEESSLGRIVRPTQDDPVVEAASTLIGGPWGRHAERGHSWWTPIRWLLLFTVVTCGLGVLADQPCRADDWTSNRQYTAACYSDVPHLFRLRGLAQGFIPYLDDPAQHHDSYEQVEYPVLTGALMWMESLPVPHGWPLNDRARFFYDVNAVVMTFLALIVVWATARTAWPRPWDAAMVALSPGLLLTAGLNWDLLAVAFTSLALLAWARRHPVWAGAFLGLGAAAKLYPALILLALFVVCLRAGRGRVFLRTLAAAVLAWLVVDVPVMIANFDGWVRFYQMSRDRGADFGSFWLVVDLHQRVLTTPVVNAAATGIVLLGAALIVRLGLTAPRRPRVAQLAFLVVSLFVVTNKVVSPQYVLWLIPLAVLARPRWRDFLWWSAAQTAYFFAIWWYVIEITNPGHGLPAAGYVPAVLLELTSTVAFAAFVVRDIRDPSCDPVRTSTGLDDPGGGVVDGVADAIRWPRSRPPSPVPAAVG
jgi:uncharacterized membrane protein